MSYHEAGFLAASKPAPPWRPPSLWPWPVRRPAVFALGPVMTLLEWSCSSFAVLFGSAFQLLQGHCACNSVIFRKINQTMHSHRLKTNTFYFCGLCCPVKISMVRFSCVLQPSQHMASSKQCSPWSASLPLACVQHYFMRDPH